MAEETYQAIVAEQVGEKFTQSVKECFLSDLPDNDVLIRVHYSSLNYKDALSATGHKGITKSYPFTPGIDAAGIVARSKSPLFSEGDKVIVTSYDLGMNTPGGFGQYISVPADWIVLLPKNLSLKESMMMGTSGLTAAIGIDKLVGHTFNQNKPEVLVSVATGGVGSFAIALLAHLNYRVVSATGKIDQTDFLISLGAKSVIHRDDVLNVHDNPLLSSRWPAAIDTVGGKMLDCILRQISHNGFVASCGNVLGNRLDTSILPFILRGITLAGIDSGIARMELRKIIWNRLADEWKPASLQKLAREVKLHDLPKEIKAILDGKQVGKVLVNLF